MKRGQIQGQVFIYILTLIITAGILIYGYNAIKKLNETSNKVQLVDFKTKLKSDIETISSDYNSVKTYTYNVPSNVKEVCFYQEPSPPGIPPISVNIPNPYILDSVKDTNNNVFLVMKNGVPDPIELPRIESDTNDVALLCIPIINGRLKLKLEGKGDGVKVGKA